MELRLDGQRLHVLVGEGQVSFPTEPATAPHVALESPPEVFAELLTGAAGVDSAVAAGRVHIEGPKRAARRFFEIFRLPAPVEATRG